MIEINLTTDLADDSSLEKLFHLYYGRLCHYAYQLIGEENAEDVVQDAFALLCDNRENISDKENALKSYLYATVRNLCFNRKRHDKVVNLYLERLVADDDAKYDKAIDHQLIYTEVMAEIHRAIHNLPKGCQAVFRLGYLEGLCNTEIAEELGISINTVKTQKQRGLKMLRETIKPEFFAALLIFLK